MYPRQHPRDPHHTRHPHLPTLQAYPLPRWRLPKLLACTALLAALVGCIVKPGDHPAPEFPPCIKEGSVAPAPGSAIDIKTNPRPTFTVTFSKEIEPSTIRDDHVFLISTEVDYYFLRDIESPPASDSRQEFVVGITLEVTSQEGQPTKLVISPVKPLQGGKTYTLVLTKNLRDRLRDIGEYKRNGSRPLNLCPDGNQNWNGEIEDYKRGQSYRFSFSTQATPQGVPQVTEVLSDPGTGKTTQRFIEVTNTSPDKVVDLCLFTIRKDGDASARNIKGRNDTCNPIPPGGRGLIIRRDYPPEDPYALNALGVPIFIAGSSTMISGGLTGKTDFILSYNGQDYKTTAPASGWFKGNKSSELCGGQWKEGPEGGTPGKTNACP